MKIKIIHLCLFLYSNNKPFNNLVNCQPHRVYMYVYDNQHIPVIKLNDEQPAALMKKSAVSTEVR